MRKVVVFQHVAYEILGTLNPALKQAGLRIRYINFDRDPDAKPSLEKCNGLIILGGNMGVYEADRYTHIKVELELIQQALEKNIPIFGICLGAQMLAQVLGGTVTKHHEKEMGWCDIELTPEGQQDGVLGHFAKKEKIFQMHGDTFTIPKSAVHLASSPVCAAQAFRYGDKVYGLQFHLEVDKAMIERWMTVPANLKDLEESNGKFSVETILAETESHIAHSLELSAQTFNNFIKLFNLKERPILMGSR